MTMHVEAMRAGKEYRVDAALLLHRSSGHNGRQDAFVTMHAVEHASSQDRPVIQAGRVVGMAELEQCLQIGGRGEGLRLLPPNLLAATKSHLVWWRPASPARVWFNVRDDERLQNRTAVVPQPGLVFAASRGDLRVFAVKGRERPTEDTALMVSPYFNVWKGGKVCVGNADLPRHVRWDAMAGFEDGFFGSRFTHPNIHERNALVKWPGGPSAFWHSLLEGRHKAFPERALVDGKLTLAGLLADLNGGGRRKA